MLATEISPDNSLQELGMDAVNLEELRIIIEEDYKIEISVIEEEHHESDIDYVASNLKDLTLREIAGWVDDWINRDEIQPRFHGRHAKLS
jgi:acyl carrier protein